MSIYALRQSLAAATLVVLCAFAPVHDSAHAQSAADIETIGTFLDLMNKYYALIESMHASASDPERATILQLHKIQEVYEEGGNKADVEPVFRKVLAESNNPTIRAATTLMLGELLKETGRRRDAIDVLEKGIEESLRSAR